MKSLTLVLCLLSYTVFAGINPGTRRPESLPVGEGSSLVITTGQASTKVKIFNEAAKALYFHLENTQNTDVVCNRTLEARRGGYYSRRVQTSGYAYSCELELSSFSAPSVSYGKSRSYPSRENPDYYVVEVSGDAAATLETARNGAGQYSCGKKREGHPRYQKIVPACWIYVAKNGVLGL